MSGPLDAYEPAELPALPPALPEASIGDVFGASRDLAAGDLAVGPFRRDRDAWEPVIDALGLNAYDNPAYFGSDRFGRPSGLKQRSVLGLWGGNADRDEQEALVLERLRERRAREPNFLPGVPDTPAAFRAWVIDRERQRRDTARETLARSPGGVVAGAAELAGGAIEGFTDPLNIMTLPVGGGGKTLAQILLRESLINAGLEAAQSPLIARNRAELGEELTLREAAINSLATGLFGGALETGGAAAVRGIGRAIDVMTPIDRKLARALETAELPAIARDAIGWERMTPAERAAVNVIEREFEIDGTTPFGKGGPSLETHGEKLAGAIRAIADEAPPVPAPITPASPAPAPPVSRGTFGFDRYMAQVAGVESGGSLTARNPRSSAEGLFQFTDGTWLAYYRQRFGDGLSDAAILAKKGDRGLQEQLFRDLTADNARLLARGGEAETAGNLYLAHFAGPKGALRILKADPDTPIERILSADAIAANPFLRGKTAGDVAEWAHAKMGEANLAGQRVTLDRANFPSGDTGELEWRMAQASLDAELVARLQAERAEIAGGAPAPAQRPIAIAPEQELTPWTRADAEDGPDMPERPEVAEPDPAVLALLPAIRQAIATPGLSLDPAKLARRLQTTEALAREALARIAARSRAVLVDRRGRFRRPLQRREEPDIVTWVADRGGVRDDVNIRGDYGAHQMAERLKAFVPGAGPLHRKSGMSLDELGEALWEDGWFRERPSTADVLDLLERGVAAYGGPKAKRIYHPNRVADVRAQIEAEVTDEALLSRIHGVAGEIELSDDMAQQVARSFERYLGADQDVDAAIERAIFDELAYEFEQVQRMALFDNEEALYDALAELEAEGYVGSTDRAGGEDLGEPEIFGRDADGGEALGGQSGGAGQARADFDDAEGLGPPDDPAALAAFDDPAGAGASAQIQSIEHDVRMDVGAGGLDRGAEVDPAVAARLRQEAELRAQSPLRGENVTGQEQAGTMGLDLFDAADQPTFRLSEDGDEIDAASLLRALDEDDAANAVLRGCMVPPKGAA